MADPKPAKKTAVTDPLEASKIVAKPAPEAPAPAPVVKEFKPDPTAPMEVPTVKSMKRYRVKRTTTVSLQGNITKLNEGDIVSESSYGPEHMERILSANVPLEEV